MLLAQVHALACTEATLLYTHEMRTNARTRGSMQKVGGGQSRHTDLESKSSSALIEQ